MKGKMKELVTSVTQKGQVTIPVEVRRLLGIKPRDRVVFWVGEDGEVRLRAVMMTLEQAYGAVPARKCPEDFAELGRIAWEERAYQAVREGEA